MALVALDCVRFGVKMKLRTLAYAIYNVLRSTARKSGQMGLVRRLAGPAVGRTLFRLSPGGAGPAQINGHTMYLAAPGSYPPLDMANAKYEVGTTRLFEETVEPGMVVVDIGAHVGYYTLLAAKQAGPNGKVYAFEPEQGNHALLQKNIETNGYNNVVATRMAVSDRRGSSTLFLTALDSGRHSMYHHGLPERGSVPVETTTLDSFLESEGWPHVDLIKIDVEGAEIAVLDGMPRLFGECPDLKLIIEFNPALLQDGGTAPHDFLERLSSLGWTIRIVEEPTGLLPLAEGDAPALVNRLLAADSSVNLFCMRS
jgi:FkbM family methyltransferase